MATAAQTPVSPPSGRYYPGWVSRLVITAAIIVVILVRLAGLLEDPPPPLNDPAMRNLFTLIFGFIAAFTTWIWFSFRSDHSRRLRLSAAIGMPVMVVALIGSIVTIGFSRLIHFSGSMVPRLAAKERQLDSLIPPAQDTGIDLRTTTPSDFPEFLGPGRTGWIENTNLAADWNAQQPKLLWKRPIGAGWSAFSAVNGYAVTLEQRQAEECVVCYEIETGKPVWSHAIKARHENPLGGVGPRSTPTLFEGRVFALGATGVLRCLDGATCKLLWSDDLQKRFGIDQSEDETNVMWGRSASPLIVDRTVVVPGGGRPGKAKNLVAFDLESGSLVWQAENKLEDGAADQIGYASPALATLAGRRQILIVNESTASGHDPSTGERLWSHPWPGHSNGDACSSQSVPIGTNRVLLSKGYSGGAELIELTANSQGDGLAAKSVWKVPRVLQTKFTNVVIRENHAYGLSEGILECVDLTSGKRRWKSGRFGHGQILGVGSSILALSEEGELNLVEANPEKFIQRGSIAAISGKTWNNLCLYGKKLLVRNAEEAACFELP